mgnify:CR=1 FL=1
MIFEETNDLDKYEEFVLNNSKAHFMQSRYWGEVMKYKNFIPHYVVLKDNDKIVASALLLQKKLLGKYSYYYCPRGYILDYNKSEYLEEEYNDFIESGFEEYFNKKFMFNKEAYKNDAISPIISKEKIIGYGYKYSSNVKEYINGQNLQNYLKNEKTTLMKLLSLYSYYKKIEEKLKNNSNNDNNEKYYLINEDFLINLKVESGYKLIYDDLEEHLKNNNIEKFENDIFKNVYLCLKALPEDIIKKYFKKEFDANSKLDKNNIEPKVNIYNFKKKESVNIFTNFEIIESITPFIAGINMPYEDDFFEKRDMMLSDTFLVVDIDKERIEFINKQSDIPEFPKNKRSLFEKNLQTCLNSYMKEELKQKQRLMSKLKDGKKLDKMNDIKNNDSEFSLNITEDNIDALEEEEDDIGNNEKSVMYNPFSNFNINKEFNQKISDIFFNFNANLLSNYSKYLNLDFYSSNEPPRLELLFKVDDFLKDVPNAEKEFYDKFINETQLFGNFIYMRMIPKNSKEKIIILAFDEQINIITKNKSQPIIFLDSKEYEFCNKYLLQKARKITQKEKDFYTAPENRKKLLSYGIIVEDKNKNGNISFKYPIFPKLTSELFFLDNFKDYFVPSNLNENIETINEDIISKSHLGGIQTKQEDMINYIYLSWMQMWGMTFWYCHESEKKYWFQELLKIINKTTSHEMEIYNLLFEALSEYGKESMILKLYDILLKLKLNPSFKVHNMVMKILDKKKSKNETNISNQLKKNLQKEVNMKYTKTNFKKRSFKSKYYGKILSDDIMIYAFDTCINCQENINLETLSLNYKDMTRELMWTKCPHCNEYILPKITVQFGDEINKSGKLSINTSKNDCLVLFSPYFLKVNSSNSLVRKFGTKLDVEDLMLKFNTIFWNSVWYFKLNHLDFYFFELQKLLWVKFDQIFKSINDQIFKSTNKNPKLLKDVKGQSWIVQITSNQNTPMSHVQGQPDNISFSWVQIGDTKDIIITGNIDRSLTSDY